MGLTFCVKLSVFVVGDKIGSEKAECCR